MLGRYEFDEIEINSVELKVLLVTQGINVPREELYRSLGARNRISPPNDPFACDCFLLPDETVVHMVDVGPRSPFSIVLSDDEVYISYKNRVITDIRFPPRSDFSQQMTSSGKPFKSMAVIQGLDVLSFHYLWPCEYAKKGYPCEFCNPGGFTHQMALAGQPELPFPTPQDVGEVVDYAVNKEGIASYIQITGGSTMNPQAECHQVSEMLNCIDEMAGMKNIKGEVLVYTSPPANSSDIDMVFEAGADRVACDIEVWDPDLAKRITPGKIRFAGRKRQLDTLDYIAESYGANKACSAFVVGVEPAEKFLEGAEYLASRGIVPIASIWLPHGKPVLDQTEAPGLEFYRNVICGLAGIYEEYGVEPPGNVGFNVCLCRDAWKHRGAISRKKCSS